MNAIDQAYEFAEAHYAGGYQGLIEYIFGAGGHIVETPEIFIAAFIEDGVCHVVFAAGDLKRIFGFCAAVHEFFHFDKVCWERQLAGRNSKTKFYTIDQIKKYAAR